MGTRLCRQLYPYVGESLLPPSAPDKVDTEAVAAELAALTHTVSDSWSESQDHVGGDWHPVEQGGIIVHRVRLNYGNPSASCWVLWGVLV